MSIDQSLGSQLNQRAQSDSVELSDSLKVSDRRRNTEIGPESWGIVVCPFVGAVPDTLGLVWPSFRLNFGSKSKISGRILKIVRGPFSSAEQSSNRVEAEVARTFSFGKSWGES